MTTNDKTAETAFIRNDSPRGSLDVPLLGGLTVGRGEVVEVPAEHADRLCRQAIWTRVSKADAAAAAKAAQKKRDDAQASKSTNKPTAGSKDEE